MNTEDSINQSNSNAIEKYVIEGVLTTTTPLHISQAGGGARWSIESNRIVYGEAKGSFPLTQTRSVSVFFRKREKLMENGGEEVPVSMRDTIPVIPATTLRGLLRRGAARIIEDHVIGHLNEKLTYDAYQGMHCGAISGRPDGINPSTDEIRSARTHVFYGIFGGGPRMLRGALCASDAIPITTDTIGAGLVPDSFADNCLLNVEPRKLFAVSPVVRKDDFMGSTDGAERASEVVADFNSIYAEKREQALQEIIKRVGGNNDSEADTSDRGVRTMSFREDVAIGVPFYVRLEMKGTEAQVGMLLSALDRRLPDGVGGRAALGLGALSGTLRVKNTHGKSVEVVHVNNGSVEMLEGASPYIDAMTEAVLGLGMDDINRYMTSVVSDSRTEKKGSKKAKA
jgi:CRISPR type IV-associated protein Csf2